jgi:nucleotide-binding universal stress UspA family protein
MNPERGGTMNGSIICGVDGSPESRAALRIGAQLAGQLELRLVIAHVWQTAAFPAPYGSVAVVERATQADLQAAEALVERIASEEGLADAGCRVVSGLPAERLADLADEEAAAFIVVGSRGRGAFKAAILGSVSRDVIAVARCPVLVVPPGHASTAITL